MLKCAQSEEEDKVTCAHAESVAFFFLIFSFGLKKIRTMGFFRELMAWTPSGVHATSLGSLSNENWSDSS